MIFCRIILDEEPTLEDFQSHAVRGFEPLRTLTTAQERL